VVKVDRRIRWHYSDYIITILRDSTKYRNCMVCSHYQPACWWHQLVLRTR